MTAIEPIEDEALADVEKRALETIKRAEDGRNFHIDAQTACHLSKWILSIIERTRRSEAERDAMRNDEAFIRDLFKESFETADLDGGWLQDEGEKRGYLTRVKYDPAKHGEIDVDNGDLIYILCDRLKSARALADTKGA